MKVKHLDKLFSATSIVISFFLYFCATVKRNKIKVNTFCRIKIKGSKAHSYKVSSDYQASAVLLDCAIYSAKDFKSRLNEKV